MEVLLFASTCDQSLSSNFHTPPNVKELTLRVCVNKMRASADLLRNDTIIVAGPDFTSFKPVGKFRRRHVVTEATASAHCWSPQKYLVTRSTHPGKICC